MRNTKWIYKNSSTRNLSSILNIDRDILALLQNRGIENEENIFNFLNNTVENIKNPFLLSDMEIAVNRILKALEKKESIWIYGDYDVDGITSTSLLYLAFSELGLSPNYYIPLRDEGYGLNKEAMEYIKTQGGNVIITVDCGISSHAEINFANELGLEVIVTDHHEINNGNPPALAVINPKREDNPFSFKYLAGVGTAFMLIFALYTKLNKKEDTYKFLDIVAIGTVADIVPLLEENRIFTKYGMEQLKRTHWLGISMLIKKIFEDYQIRKFNTYDIGFIIAPIFNAAGRLEDAKKAVELFIEKDHRVCSEIINELLHNNSIRKEIQEEIFQKAIETIEKDKLYEKSIILVADKDFHHGVIGIVASKILDRYYKPTIILEIKEDGTAVASCRSIEGFNIIEGIDKLSYLLLKYGGHAGAAGFSIKSENISEFYEKLNEYAKKTIPESNLIKPVKIDISIPAYKISYDFIQKISLLEPFGFGNPSPLFVLENCEISNVRAIGKEKNHIMLNVKKDEMELKNCVWFNSEDIFDELITLTHVDIVFKLKLETFKDRYQYKMYIEDIQLPNYKNNLFLDKINLYDTTFPIETVIYTRKKLENADLKLIYDEEEIIVTYNRNYLATLDVQTSYLLKRLKSNYNFDFSVVIKDIILKEENYNIHLIIDKNYTFNTYAIKQGEIFKNIKEFLIGEFNYNAIEKNILASIFKEKKNTLVIMEKNRGINTIIQTIGLFYNAIGKKALCVGDMILPKKTLNSIEIAPEFKKNYDFYIFLNPAEIDFSKFENKNILVISEKDINISNFNKITDFYKLPENIVLTTEDELFNKKYIFSKKLPISERKNIIAKLNKFNIIYATRDILTYL